MARFILDILSLDKEGISKILKVIERDDFISGKVASIRCIDETNDNQMYCHDVYTKDGVEVITSPMMNKISKKQLDRDEEILSKY